jgi:FkbM family methyltransferase
VNSTLRNLVGSTVGRLPVTVRTGLSSGARWTLYPWTSYWRGTYEPALQVAMGRLGNGDIRDWSCWDLGAHFGYYSIALARRVGAGGQVAAFEPNPRSFGRLELHRRMNALPWLKTYKAAASDRSGASELLTYGDLGSTSTHLRHDGETRSAESAPVAVRCVRLDELVGHDGLRAPKFVKIDVEGHGHRALEGMRETVAASRPTLMVGFHTDMEVEGVLGILRPLGYRWEVIGAAPPEPASLVGGDYLFTP